MRTSPLPLHGSLPSNYPYAGRRFERRFEAAEKEGRSPVVLRPGQRPVQSRARSRNTVGSSRHSV